MCYVSTTSPLPLLLRPASLNVRSTLGWPNAGARLQDSKAIIVVESQGRFVWYELITTETEAAKSFYANVVGWDTGEVSMPGTTYTLFSVGDTSVSGLLKLPNEASNLGVKPHWIGYVGVDDVDATNKRIKQLGGAVHVPPSDIPNVGRFSIIADPQMATLGLLERLQPGQERPIESNTLGCVGWHELLTVDWQKALAFYGELFGWQKAEANVGSLGAYQRFSAGGQPIGGMVTKPGKVPVPFWLYYFNIDDIDAAARRVKAGGGQILDGPVEVPYGSWIVHCTDPQGAIFALVGNRSYKAMVFFRAPRL
jgi:predicted enzyme related to lactoylglutathione lyase